MEEIHIHHHRTPTEWKRSQVRTRMEEEEEDDWTAGWMRTRAPPSGRAAEASHSPQHESRLRQQIILRDIQLKLLLFYFYVFGMSHQDSEQEAQLCPPPQHSPQSGGLRGFPLPSLLISAMDLQRLKTPSFPIG